MAAARKSWSGPALKFNIIRECSKSRCRASVLELPHHTLETPTFMPVGTKGTMKGLLPEQVEAAGADIILGNTYHLGTRPGKEILNEAGGLHKWMKWNRALLTDSGGFQMVSLLKLAKITEEGVTFQSPYDGSECVLTPEESMSIQNAIGADIMMQLDDVVDVQETDYERFKEATCRTTRWLDRCIAANKNPDTQNLFPIVQGGLFPDLRDLSLTQLLERDSPGYAVGGLSGGEDKHQFWTTIHQCTGKLPVNKPRYCMGVGFAPDLVVCVALGVDMFDCVYPTRTARFGCALIETGQFSLKSTKYAEDFSPLDATCLCDTCKHYTRAYIHAAMVTKNTIGCHLLSVHNIAYLTRLMRDIRESVKNDSFSEFVNDFFQKYYKDSVPKWIVDALAAVNIIVTKSEWSISSATGDGTSESSPVYAGGQDYEQASTTQEFLQSPMDLKTVSSTNVRPDRKASSEHDIEDHNNVVLVKMDEVHVTEEEKGILNDSNDWLDIDNVEGNDSYVRDQIVSEFETRSYDQGFRDTLRMDHPDEEERGRAAGFVNAFNFALSDDGQEDDASKARALKSKGVQPQKLPASCCQVALSQKNDHSSVTNLTHRLSILDGSLSLMLLKYQTVMTDEHLREVVSVKESIKNELEKADLKYEFSIERSLTLRFSKPCDDLESKLISVHNASDAQQCECKSQGNKCITERSSSGTTSSKSDSDATDDQITCDTLYTVSHTGHSDSNFSENCSLTARELISRANKVCSQLNWKIPLA